jgi:hypothetical protein
MTLITFMEIIVGFGEEEFMPRILSIDPSGTGTTGICLIKGNTYFFSSYQDKYKD